MPVIKSMIFKCLCFPPHFQHFIIVLRELLDNYPKFLRHQFSKHKLLSCTLKSWVEVIFVAVVQSLCPLFVTPWAATHQASLSFTISQSLLKLMPIQSVTPSNHLILCHPLLLLPSVLPSIRVFFNESALHIRLPKYWRFSFSFSICPSNEYAGLISFRIDWFDLLADQRTLKSLLKHHSSKASIFWLSASFMVQLSHPYMTAEKTIALTIWTFVSKVISLLCNTLSSSVIAFLPGN